MKRFLNGYSLTEASSRWFVRLRLKKSKKKTKQKKNRKSKGVLLEKILIIYLKCNAVKELGIKKKKKFCFGSIPITKRQLRPFLQTSVLQLNETLFYFFVISMVRTIGAINTFKKILKLQFHDMAVVSRWHSLVFL